MGDNNADYVIAAIPRGVGGYGYWGYTPVPGDVVYEAIEVLQCHVARYSGVGVVPDETGITTLQIATCRVLAALLAANAARSKEYGAVEVIEQIDDLLRGPEARRHLEAMRGRHADRVDIVDALLALEPRVKDRHPAPRPASARGDEPRQPADHTQGHETGEGDGQGGPEQ